jgi:serine/threonine protein kinase/Flp pilus assembly protein TadD
VEQLGHKQQSAEHGGEKGLPAELYTLYEIGAEIGRGPSSRVFDATDPRTGRKGTLKLLYPAAYSEAEQARIRREWVKQSALVESDKLLVPRASGEAGKALWLFRAKVDGVPLDVVLSDGAIVPESAMAMAMQLAQALDELHKAGLLHRDVKPEHVLVRASFAGPPRIALIDAGLAGSIETGTRYDVFGTPGYVSPEQITGKLVGFRSDLYALGCVFYEMVTGLPLFQADSVNELLILHATAPRPALPASLPAEVAALLGSLIAIDPRQRPLSAQHVIRTLEKFVQQSVSVSTSGSVVARRSVLPMNNVPALANNAVAVDREVEAVVNKEAIVKESELNLAEIQDAFAQSSLLGIAQDAASTNPQASKAPRPLRDETAGRFSYEQMKAEAAARAAGIPVPAQRISAPPVVPAASLPAINARGASSVAPRIGSVTQGSIPAINARGYASVAPPVLNVRTSEASPPPLPPISSAFLDSQQFENAQFVSEEVGAADYAGNLFDEARGAEEDVHEVDAAELSPETNRFAQPQFTRTEMASIGGWESAPTPMFVKSPASSENTQEIDLEAIEAAAFDATPIDDLGLERLTIPDISRSVSMAEIAATEKTKKGIFVLTVVIAFLFGTAVAIGATILYLRGTAAPATPAVAAATPAVVTPAVVAAPAAPAVAAAPTPAPTEPAVAEVAAQPVAEEPAVIEPVAAAAAVEAAPVEAAPAEPVAAKAVAAKSVAAKSARESKRERDAARRAEKQERLAAAAAAKAEKAAAKAAAKAEALAAAPKASTSVDDLLNTPAPKASKAVAIAPTAPASEPSAANDATSAFEQIRAEAKELYNAGRYKDAATGYERATTLNPSHAGAFAGLGASRTAMGDAKGAISAYIKAVQLAPTKSGYFAALGRAYATTGDVTNAERAYKKALSLDANNGAARQGLTEIGR